MATVGYGDVHAEGQLARALVCALIVFSVVVVASLVRAAPDADQVIEGRGPEQATPRVVTNDNRTARKHVVGDQTSR